MVWSSADKFGVVPQTARINEAELAEYCRGIGLLVEQVVGSREACQQANEAPAERDRELREQKRSDQRNQALEERLQRKEEALAGAAVLTISRRKSQAISSKPEDD